MPRADVKLFEVLADQVCLGLLRCLLNADGPLTQSQLAAKLAVSSGIVSRRMGELETIGIVERASSHAPYTLVFPSETRGLLSGAADLAANAYGGLHADAAAYARELKKESLAGGNLRDRAREANDSHG